MKRLLSYLAFALLPVTLPAAAQDTRNFTSFTVLHKGENAFGANAIYNSFDSSNSEFLLLVNGFDANGSILRGGFSYYRAFKDNSALGVRLNYGTATTDLKHVNLGLLSDDLAIDINDISLGGNSFSLGFFHRLYFGFESSGTAGMFFESSLGWTLNRISIGSDSSNVINSVSVSLSPGLIVYVLPFVSLEASMGLADVGYSISDVVSNGVHSGYYDSWKGGIRFNLMNVKFEIAIHF